MQNFQQTPLFSDVADWFAYPALTAAQQTSIRIDAAGGGNKGYITLQPQHYFAHCAFAAVTNYDNVGGVFATTAAAAVLALPSTPNTFSVEIQRASSNNYSNAAMTQAEVCSAGILSGKQVPLPVIYGPAVTLSFQFTDLTGLYLLDADAEPVPLDIQFWMIGYSIPQGDNDANWYRFLDFFPHLKCAYV